MVGPESGRSKIKKYETKNSGEEACDWAYGSGQKKQCWDAVSLLDVNHLSPGGLERQEVEERLYPQQPLTTVELSMLT